MWKRFIAGVLAVTVPATASAGPLADAVDKVARDMAAKETRVPGNRARTWTGISLVGTGALLTVLGAIELGEDDEVGPDDDEDLDDSDDAEDSDGWSHNAMLGGGIAAAVLGTTLLLTAPSGPQFSVKRGRISIHQTLRF